MKCLVFLNTVSLWLQRLQEDDGFEKGVEAPVICNTCMLRMESDHAVAV